MPETENATVRNMVLTFFSQPPEWDVIKAKIRYFAYGDEVCPETQRPHKQAFAQAWKPMRFTQWKKLFPSVHMEAMRGTFRESSAYCSKEGRLTEFGEKPNENGVKTTIVNYKRKLDEGQGVLAVAEAEDYFPTYLQYRNGLHEYARYIRQNKLQENRDVPSVYVRLGPPGTGKTRWLDDTFGFDGWRRAPDNKGQWFDGCDERDVILFDDVEAGQVPSLSLFKQLTDRYPFKVPIKGGFITWKPRVIVFTSNTHPTEWWPNMSSFDKEAVERRLTDVVVVE